MVKHTPGPWSFNQAKGKVLACVAMAGKLLVFKSKVSDADGQLIAAAPELLEALVAVLNAGRGTSGRIILDAEDEALARAAIARARGEA